MDMKDYQDKAHSFATQGGDTLVYSILEIAEELAELCERLNFTDLDVFHCDSICSRVKIALADLQANKGHWGKLAKSIRKEWNNFKASEKMALTNFTEDNLAVSECGDILWGVANVAYHLGASLSDVAESNIKKLSERKNTNTIIGSGETVADRKANG